MRSSMAPGSNASVTENTPRALNAFLLGIGTLVQSRVMMRYSAPESNILIPLYPFVVGGAGVFCVLYAWRSWAGASGPERFLIFIAVLSGIGAVLMALVVGLLILHGPIVP